MRERSIMPICWLALMLVVVFAGWIIIYQPNKAEISSVKIGQIWAEPPLENPFDNNSLRTFRKVKDIKNGYVQYYFNDGEPDFSGELTNSTDIITFIRLGDLYAEPNRLAYPIIFGESSKPHLEVIPDKEFAHSIVIEPNENYCLIPPPSSLTRFRCSKHGDIGCAIGVWDKTYCSECVCELLCEFFDRHIIALEDYESEVNND